MYALDAVSGSLKWRFSAGAAVETGILFVPGFEAADDVIYFGSDDGHVYCVTASNGSMQWKSDGQFGPLLATPVIAVYFDPIYFVNLTLVVIGGTSGTLTYVVAQISPANSSLHVVGSTFRQQQLASTIWSFSVIPPPNNIDIGYMISTDQGFVLCRYKLSSDPSDPDYYCRVVLSANLDPKVPLVFGPGGTVYAALSSGSAAAFSCAQPPQPYYSSCSTMFVFEAAGPMIGAMVLGADGTLYGNAQGTLFAAYSTGPIGGKTNWQAHFYQQASTGVTLSNTTLIAGTWKNTLFGVCTQGSCTGLLNWQVQLPQSVTAHLFSSVVASSDGSRLYISSLDHSVYCVALV